MRTQSAQISITIVDVVPIISYPSNPEVCTKTLACATNSPINAGYTVRASRSLHLCG